MILFLRNKVSNIQGEKTSTVYGDRRTQNQKPKGFLLIRHRKVPLIAAAELNVKRFDLRILNSIIGRIYQRDKRNIRPIHKIFWWWSRLLHMSLADSSNLNSFTCVYCPYREKYSLPSICRRRLCDSQCVPNTNYDFFCIPRLFEIIAFKLSFPHAKWHCSVMEGTTEKTSNERITMIPRLEYFFSHSTNANRRRNTFRQRLIDRHQFSPRFSLLGRTAKDRIANEAQTQN